PVARVPFPRAVRRGVEERPRPRGRADHRGDPRRERRTQDGLAGRAAARRGAGAPPCQASISKENTMAVATQTETHAEDKELLISGSEAVAEGLTLADIDVVTGYPIRPYDTVIQAIAKKIAN